MKNKIIAVLLSVTLILGVMPVVSAQTSDKEIMQTAVNANTEKVENEPYIVGELVEKRTANTKSFLMSDRTVTAAQYNNSVHYKSNGKWENIDNSFVTRENDFENKSNSIKTKFSKKSNGNNLVTLKKDEFSLSWFIENANKVNAEVNKTSETESADIYELKNLEGIVTYPAIQNNVDLQYVVSGENVKENIILKNSSAPTEFSFDYKFNKSQIAIAS